MLLNLRLDGNCLHVLCSTKTLPISPLDKFPPIKKLKQNYVPGTHDGDKRPPQRSTRHCDHHRGIGTVAHEVIAGKNLLFVYPGYIRVGKSRISDGFVGKRPGVAGFGGNGMVEKVHAKCSMKVLSYGGCIPAIFESLDRIEDVEEALSPCGGEDDDHKGADTVEIFEWFKNKDFFWELRVFVFQCQMDCK